jgi:hypothetical protein
MILKDFLDFFKPIEIKASVSGNSTPTIVIDGYSSWVTNRFEIEFFDGVKIEKHLFKAIKDIPENLLLAKIIKTNIHINWNPHTYDNSVFKFIVTN